MLLTARGLADDEFWDASKTVDEITRERYFVDRSSAESGDATDTGGGGEDATTANWPPVLRTAVQDMHGTRMSGGWLRLWVGVCLFL